MRPGSEPGRAGKTVEPNGSVYHAVVSVATAAIVLLATGGLVSAQGHVLRHPPVFGQQGASPVTAPATTVLPPTSSTTSTTAMPPRATSTSTTVPPIPRALSITPPRGTNGVAPTTPVTIVLSGPPVPGAPMPVLRPVTPGVWSVKGHTVRFTPSVGFAPWSTERLTVPAALATATKSQFTVEGVPLVRAEQLLAELKFLPLRFGTSPTASSLDLEPEVPDLVSAVPQPGSFTWRYPGIPSTLSALWSPGHANVLTRGAVMRFEDQENLAVDGVIGPDVWRALSAAVAARRTDLSPYDYLVVSEALPEQLVVWREGKDVYRAPVNTGVPGATTPAGTWPVYERFQTTTMIGTDVGGYHYDVANVPWVAYFYGGDAVHGYWRSGYGYPQSNGCVELPVPNAQVVWPMDPLGTLVTVTT